MTMLLMHMEACLAFTYLSWIPRNKPIHTHLKAIRLFLDVIIVHNLKNKLVA